MDNQEHNSSLELPSPSGSNTPNSLSPEAQGIQPELATSQGSPASAVSAQQATHAQPLAVATSDQPAHTAAAASAHLSADDTDLIEKEWVARAKHIVETTHGDPYTQNNEINKIKADYIKKRYNKDIKQSSD